MLKICCQVTEEEAVRKELNKDLTAITNLMSNCRAASMAVSTMPCTAELQKDLKEKIVMVKQHQDKIEEMVFGKKSRASKQDKRTGSILRLSLVMTLFSEI